MNLDPMEYRGAAKAVAINFYLRGGPRLRLATTLDDLIAEADVGLMVACKRWNPDLSGEPGRHVALRVKYHLLDWYRSVYGKRRPAKAAHAYLGLAHFDLDAVAHVPEGDATPEEIVEVIDLTERVAAMRDGEIMLRYASGETLRQIGDDLGVSEARICQRIQRGRAELRALQVAA